MTVDPILAMMNGVPVGEHLGKQVRDVVGNDVAPFLEKRLESIFESRSPGLMFDVTAKLPYR